jgi:hypothetical protein
MIVAERAFIREVDKIGRLVITTHLARLRTLVAYVQVRNRVERI